MIITMKTEMTIVPPVPRVPMIAPVIPEDVCGSMSRNPRVEFGSGVLRLIWS